MNVLEVKNLSLGFDSEDGFNQAVYDVSFNLKKGQMHAIVGESGCGKTLSSMSVLRLLPKNCRIISGEIIYHGENLLEKNIKDMEKIRGAKVSLIPQDPMTSLNPLYTVGNQLIEVIKKHHHVDNKEAKKRAIEALDLVQIPCAASRLDSYPHEFSGGMKQRAIIAMSLVCNSEVIIADEPTTALDVTIQAQIMELLNTIKKDFGTSILLITHDLALVGQNADEVSVMYAGKIVEHALADKFFTTAKHPYSLALLKSLPSSVRYGQRKLYTLSGRPPEITENITGCCFHPRCEYCMPKICNQTEPKTKVVGFNHTVACHLM